MNVLDLTTNTGLIQGLMLNTGPYFLHFRGRPIMEKKKRNRSYVEEIERSEFFSFWKSRLHSLIY